MILPANPFLQLVPTRAAKALERLEHKIWLDAVPVEVHHIEASPKHRSLAEAKTLPLRRAEGFFRWGKMFDQKWFRVVLPTPAQPGEYLHWRPQGESTVYHEGAPHYGLDIAHTYCPLPVGATELWLDGLCAETETWTLGDGGAITAEGCRFLGGSRVRRDDEAWGAYHDLWFLFELLREEHKVARPGGAPFPGLWGHLPPMTSISLLHRRLLRGIDDAINALDHGGVLAMRAALRATLAALPADNLDMTYTATGHAHIDLVWRWPERAGEAKAVHSFATMNRLMDAYPEFRFGYSQPASYAAVGRRSPALMERVRARIGEGRWEATGAAEVESDTNLSCGESLARSLIVGQRRFRELRADGSASRTLWLPDVFGYSAALPQILAQTGVTSFFTTKLTWGTINEFPYSSFVWRGPDGSEVLAFVSQGYGYGGRATPGEMQRAVQGHRQSDVHPEVLAPTGHGDGGGGTTEAMCERMRRAADLAGVPRARWGGIEEFFDRLETRRAKLPVFQGELYFEYHRGVYTSVSRIKAANRACERALQTWESVRAAQGGPEIPQAVWQRVIFTQFHDYLPGSSRQEVYDEGIPELHALAADALAAAVTELGTSPGGEAPALWNPLPYARTVWMDGVARRLEPLSGGPITSLAVLATATLRADATQIANDRVSASFDASGRVTSLTVGGRSLALNGAAAELVVFPDHPHMFDAWDIDRSTLTLGQVVPPDADVLGSGVADGVAFVAFRRQLTAKSSAVIHYALAAHEVALRVDYDLDWQDEETLLQVVFPTRYQGRFARYGTPFGSVLRSQQPGLERDEAQWEVPASRWAAVMDDGDAEGLAVVTEAKFGFACRSGHLSLSLVRSPEYPSLDEPASVKHATNLTRCSDLGRHRIRIALSLHAADRPRDEQPCALAETLFTPTLIYAGSEARHAGFLGLDGGDSLHPAWAKSAQDGRGWILRLHETLGHRGAARLRLAPGWTASLTDLIESPGTPITDTVAFTPYQLLSIRLLA